MIVEFELKGSKGIHKGLFDTNGLWVKYEEQQDSGVVEGYKLFSHFSFAFYHEDKAVVDLVYTRLVSVLRGAQGHDIEEIGYIRKVNK